jgi:hypothetical protein
MGFPLGYPVFQQANGPLNPFPWPFRLRHHLRTSLLPVYADPITSAKILFGTLPLKSMGIISMLALSTTIQAKRLRVRMPLSAMPQGTTQHTGRVFDSPDQSISGWLA